ncbi:MAG TPA: hypothetical protein VKU00_24595 [Chthonomonadaceae bacterium]|nr:hypothetical protein [Chthonomonadaceae bacterium]
MFRRTYTVVLLLGCLMALSGVGAAQTAPQDKAQMQTPDAQSAYEKDLKITEQVKSGRELGLCYRILQNNWQDIALDSTKIQMISLVVHQEFDSGVQTYPHLFDAIDLGVQDPSPKVQAAALALLEDNLGQHCADTAAYLDWRQKIGDKSPIAILQENYRALFAQLTHADDMQKIALLDRLSQGSFGADGYFVQKRDNYSIEVGNRSAGRNRLLHRIALEENLPDILSRLFTADTRPEVQSRALMLFARLSPSEEVVTKYEAQLHRMIPPLIAQHGNNSQMILLLSRVEARWANDLLLHILSSDLVEKDIFPVLMGVETHYERRAIPALIALLDACEGDSISAMISSTLIDVSGMRGTTVGVPKDVEGWLKWWESAKLPAEVRAQPFPVYKEISGIHRDTDPDQRTSRRKRELFQIGEDPHRTYWLISAGTQAKDANGVIPAQNINPLLLDDSGLLVVLSDEDGDMLPVRVFWRQVARALGGRYVIALVRRAQWSESQPVLWVTSQNRKQVPQATFTTESLVADVVNHVKARIPLDPNRIFLHGEGEAGMAAYACSLQQQTPFQGFYLLSAPFHTVQLPPLTQAKGRRYYIQHSQTDRITPYFLASAAVTLLKREGATTQLDTYPGDHGYHFQGSSVEAVAKAFHQLEMRH